MKTTIKNTRQLILVAAVLICNKINAQDIIVTKSNQTLKVKVIEVGTTEIKYKFFDAQDGPLISIKKNDIKTLKIQGKTGDNVVDLGNNDPMNISNSSILDKTSSLKFAFFSPLDNHLDFSYEWMNKPGFNWETGLGIIGVGSKALGQENTKAKGAYVKAGAKFLLGNSSDYEIEGVRYAHPLKGRYFKVEMVLNAFSTSYQVDTSYFNYYSNNTKNDLKLNVKNSYQSVGLNLIYGRQYILGNSITAGYYVGAGYALENMRSNLLSNDDYYAYDINRYSHIYCGEKFPITFTGGFNVGYILKTPSFASKAAHHSIPPTRHSMR
jgi:hypothetical protein